MAESMNRFSPYFDYFLNRRNEYPDPRIRHRMSRKERHKISCVRGGGGENRKNVALSANSTKQRSRKTSLPTLHSSRRQTRPLW